ncbi:MAG: extracellular solute-binding protein [Chloroflexi bacterium]|nr:extracellular solute-binding protein [Chloroflexota bacterium]
MMDQSLTRRGVLRLLEGAATLAAAGLLAACGTVPTSAPKAVVTTTKAAGTPAATPTVDVLAQLKSAKTPLTITGNPTDMAAQARVTLWNKQHPDAQVTIIQLSLGQGVEAESKYIALLAGGTPPSVVVFDRFQVATYAIRGAFRSLDDLIGQEKYDMGRFMKATVDEGKGMDGKQYALPTGTDDRLFYWNKDLFQQAGLDPEKPPQDWPTLKDYAVRLTKSQGTQVQQLGMGMNFGPQAFYLWSWAGGGHWLKRLGNGKPDPWHADINNAANADALSFLYGLLQAQNGQRPLAWAQKNGGLPGIQNVAWSVLPQFQDAFSASKVAMAVAGNWALGGIARTYSQTHLNFGVTSIPRKDATMPPLTWSGGWSYVISRGIKDPASAFKLATTFLSKEYFLVSSAAAEADQQKKTPGAIYFPGSTAQPAIDKVLHTQYKANIAAVDNAWDTSQQLMGHSRFRPLTAAAAEMWDAERLVWDQALSGMPPQQALDQAQQTVQVVLDQRAQQLLGK